jgi:hypothetical protein
MKKQIDLPASFERGFLELNLVRQASGKRPLTKKRALEIILGDVFPLKENAPLTNKLLEE